MRAFRGNDQCVRDVVSGVLHSSVLEPLLFIVYTSELFRIVGNHILINMDDTTIYAVIPRPLSHPQVMESLNAESRFDSNLFLVFEAVHEHRS